MEKVDEFDLIIFDRYKRRGILPNHYFDNIARYVRDGGALLIASGADFAGVVSLTSAKSAALVGVAVSVTTVPAAADVGVAAAAGNWGECGGAAAQLVVNLVSLVVAGAATLAVRKRASQRARVRTGRG